ncbi:uncharacterized protein RHOBADRAFT_40743 [Rhodotorula graminis WP1]|uniref:Uncharacterized protein n=1 Tax=Rhodotorula graminis (strain WP1) TaxID=578459 RepID=A0A194SCM7_RHOGW|nr:uncharacterized protein RHOBADRAFT_40743 [Rhodotorula graminis WP1]KPV78200.1 hypothetical protein RHOBADRAFT_40743 [Rhodotorula graminis WP1]
MDLVAQLIGTICDGILQSCAETQTSLVRDSCGACCPCAAPCCSQEAGWDSLGETEDEGAEAAGGRGEAVGADAAGSSAAERAQEQQGLARGARAGYGAVEEQPVQRARMRPAG